MKKAVLLALVAMIAGTAIGGTKALTKYEEPELILASHQSVAKEPLPKIKDAKPRVYVPGETTYDFGIMQRNEELSHTFQVRNIGSGPLTLKVVDTTCKCTVGSLGKDEVAPGDTADVTLTWEARSYDREFRQSATIETNDQSQREIVFSVTGQVLQLARPDRHFVKFSRVSRSEPRQFTFRVYAYRDEDFAIASHGFRDQELAEFFSVSTEPLPADQWGDPEAKAATRVTVDIKPGLPQGIVRQMLVLHPNKIDIAPLEIAIDMTIISDISAIGPRNFNDETNLLVLGPVSRASGESVTLFLIVKGPHRDEVDFTVAEVDPASALEAKVGPPRAINDGLVRRFPLTITVPPGSPSVYRMGSEQGSVGRVVLDTGHPEIKQFEIKVRFVVQE